MKDYVIKGSLKEAEDVLRSLGFVTRIEEQKVVTHRINKKWWFLPEDLKTRIVKCKHYELKKVYKKSEYVIKIYDNPTFIFWRTATVPFGNSNFEGRKIVYARLSQEQLTFKRTIIS